MGNKPVRSTKHNSSQNVPSMYQELISKDFEDEISMMAAQKYPENLENAVHFILDHQQTHDNQTKTVYEHLNEDDNKVNNQTPKPTNSTMTYSPSQSENTGCRDVNTCLSLKRLVKLLTFYQSNKDNPDHIQIYFDKNKNIIVSDYHHLIDAHLNEDNIDKAISDKTFEEIYNVFINESGNGLKCDINKCKIYRRNNRDRNCGNTDENPRNSDGFNGYIG